MSILQKDNSKHSIFSLRQFTRKQEKIIHFIICHVSAVASQVEEEDLTKL